MEDVNLAILVDAKTEYTKQLVQIISPNIFIGIKTIYNDAIEYLWFFLFYIFL